MTMFYARSCLNGVAFLLEVILKVVDAYTHSCLAKYDIPVTYLVPFHQYHCELVAVSIVIFIHINSNVTSQKKVKVSSF